MIVTLTVNPAIDRTITVDRLAFEDRAHILSTKDTPGGRGINSSCVIHSFGGTTKAIVPEGGAAGKRFRELLAECGYPVVFMPLRSKIRTNLVITDHRGLTVKLNEYGPRITASELLKIEKTVHANIRGTDWLMLCGSLPPGVPADFYARLIRFAHQREVKTFLDTDSEALRDGLEARPTVVSPNQEEAERLLNAALVTRAQCLAAAARILKMGAESVILSLGGRGAIGAFQDRVVEVIPPRVDAVCAIGAGDALAAAFVWALENKSEVNDALRWGVAAGSASARLPGMKFATLEQAREIYPEVEVRAVE